MANINKATVQDFVTAFDDIETVVMSDPDGSSLLDEDISQFGMADTDRIQKALDDADCFIKAFYIKALPMGRAFIKQIWHRAMLVIARHYLDTVKARQPVTEAHDKYVMWLEQACKMKTNIALTEDEQLELGVEIKQSGNIQFHNQQRVWDRRILTPYRKDRLLWR